MRVYRTVTNAVVVVIAAALMLVSPAVVQTDTIEILPAANAASCPDIEVIFARGRLEPPGPGVLGSAFVSTLRSTVPKDIDLYSVQYPANTEVDIGANDMSQRIQYMTSNCPNTQLVLGGYSLGAAVTDLVVALPFAAFGFRNPLPASSDGHIAAVALFGNGSQWVSPITAFNPAFASKTIELCHGADPICNPADPDTWRDNWPQHLAAAYMKSGMVQQSVDFVAGKLG